MQNAKDRYAVAKYVYYFVEHLGIENIFLSCNTKRSLKHENICALVLLAHLYYINAQIVGPVLCRTVRNCSS